MSKNLLQTILILSWLTLATIGSRLVQAQVSAIDKSLVVATEETPDGQVSRGYFEVFENRETELGRKIKLNLVVLHAHGENPVKDPVFYLAGGPGIGAATLAPMFRQHWMRRKRDIVFVSQRGTDGDNRLAFEVPKNAALQHLLDVFPTKDVVLENLQRLEKTADLRMYSTPDAMDDLNDVRHALGYEKINLVGGSYGTRASLVYIRRHGETVRTAILDGVAPIEFRNPLYHAEGGQRTLGLIFDEVESNEVYRAAFPDLREKFLAILKRLDESPVEVAVKNMSTGETETVLFGRDEFANSLRFQMYYLDTTRRIPLLLQQAFEGNYREFVVSSMRRNLALRNAISMGMLMSVTTAEDVARIDQAEIEDLTAGTFTGAGRVRRQIAAAEIWPKSKLPHNYGEPVVSDVPALILSGTIDPVTPPKWGEMVAGNFPNSLHLVAPAAHGVGGDCIENIRAAFLEAGTVMGLDTSCVANMKLPPLELPAVQGK